MTPPQSDHTHIRRGTLLPSQSGWHCSADRPRVQTRLASTGSVHGDPCPLCPRSTRSPLHHPRRARGIQRAPLPVWSAAPVASLRGGNMCLLKLKRIHNLINFEWSKNGYSNCGTYQKVLFSPLGGAQIQGGGAGHS